MRETRRRLFEIIEPSDGINRLSSIYDYSMIAVIAASLVPLTCKTSTGIIRGIDGVCVAIFILDYLLRWATADLKYRRGGVLPFLRYPFSLMAIIDLLSILPSVTVLGSGFLFLRLIKAIRVLRVFKAARYSKSIQVIVRVFKRSRSPLIAVVTLAVTYILISALVIFNAEPDTFDSFFSAVYWAAVSLTTIGYGDLVPQTTLGRIIAMLSSLFGIAIVALPSGIITAGFMSVLQETEQEKLNHL